MWLTFFHSDKSCTLFRDGVFMYTIKKLSKKKYDGCLLTFIQGSQTDSGKKQSSPQHSINK